VIPLETVCGRRNAPGDRRNGSWQTPDQDPFNPLRAQLRSVRIDPGYRDGSALARDHLDVTGLQSAVADRRPGQDRRCGSIGEVLSIGADFCRVMADGSTAGLRLGMSAVNLGSPMIAPCDGWRGRIVDPYGSAMDDRPLPLGDGAAGDLLSATATRHASGPG
jgi:flagellum-specific ATP synthase